jgi:ribosomal protein S18 acetylase RimI-like enzyme
MSRRKPTPAVSRLSVTIRPAVAGDADGIVRTFLESAKHHASLEPARYDVPSSEVIFTRYREGQRHRDDSDGKSITFVADLGGQIVGFIDARLEQSADPMHRDLVYCDIAEIAVAGRDRNKGIGRQLLQAAETWGRKQGADYASLEYHAANTTASRFYQNRMGYRAAHIIAIKQL